MLKIVLLSILIHQLLASRDLDRLARGLFNNYADFVDPGNVTVVFGVTLVQFDYDKKTEILTSRIWERMSWKDDRLMWNPSEYNGIDSINIPSRMVWKPDIMLFYEEYDSSIGRQGQDVNVVIDNEGGVTWVPPATYKSICLTSGGNGPHMCRLKFGSWTYDGHRMNVVLPEDGQGIDLSSYIVSNRYDLLNATSVKNIIHYSCCTEPYVDISLTITFTEINMN